MAPPSIEGGGVALEEDGPAGSATRERSSGAKSEESMAGAADLHAVASNVQIAARRFGRGDCRGV